ncbi:hypothetical protein IQ782_24645 [Salipiger pacificus]|uniref:Uncharacterized protein n=1 Tax=Salipiger mangrovisoli TaxID=2865933 RepID=A0ABR9X912_9RHOB|nr:hypothetical protein [Salipiger mangrovisoli]
MAGKALNKKNLLELGADTLADLLLEAVTGSETASKTRALGFAFRAGSVEGARLDMFAAAASEATAARSCLAGSGTGGASQTARADARRSSSAMTRAATGIFWL